MSFVPVLCLRKKEVHSKKDPSGFSSSVLSLIFDPFAPILHSKLWSKTMVKNHQSHAEPLSTWAIGVVTGCVSENRYCTWAIGVVTGCVSENRYCWRSDERRRAMFVAISTVCSRQIPPARSYRQQCCPCIMATAGRWAIDGACDSC